MLPTLAQHLIALAAAVSDDRGAGVLRVLREVLCSQAPFDAGEVALAHTAGFHRWTLTDDDRPLVAEDLLLDVASHPEVRRIDELQELDAFPRSRDRLAARGLQSLLVLPLSQAGGGRGAVLLGREYTWGFVGASLRVLVPVAAMTGLALDWARALERPTRLAERWAGGWAHHPGRAEAEAERQALQAENERLRTQLDELRAEHARLGAELDALRPVALGGPPPPPPGRSGGRRGRRR